MLVFAQSITPYTISDSPYLDMNIHMASGREKGFKSLLF